LVLAGSAIISALVEVETITDYGISKGRNIGITSTVILEIPATAQNYGLLRYINHAIGKD
jgi:hypothetical protein